MERIWTMYSLRLFGGLSLEGADGPVTGRPAQHRRLAMLALLATQRTAMVSREKVLGYLWPDTHPERARHLLADSVYVLRKALGEDIVLSSNDDLGLNPDIVETDVRAFDEAIDRKDPAAATSLYVGPFLDGFHMKSAPEFEHWVDDQRRRFADRYAKALEDLAEDASRRGDLSQSVELWRKLAAHDAYDSRIALSFVNALRAAGDNAGAVRHAQRHEILLREELGVAPSPDLLDAIRQLQRAPTDLQAMSTESRPVAPVAPDRIATDDDTVLGSAKPAVRWLPVSVVAAAVILIVGATWFTGGLGKRAPRADADIPRLLVLPMENLGNAEDDYFADGVTDEITSRLAGLSGLRVIARQTAIQYKGSPLSAREIADELDVDYVLEGTVRTDRAPDGSGQVRITPQLIRTSDETHLWAEPYTVPLIPGEIFRVQAEIALRIVERMDVVLSEPEEEAITLAATDNPEAYDNYLRGVSYRDRRLRRIEDRRLAAEMFGRAIELDSEYVDAYVAFARQQQLLFGEHAQLTAGPLAKAAVYRITELMPDHPTSYLAQASYHISVTRRYDLAEQHLSAALRAKPDDWSIVFFLARVQKARGKYEEALTTYQKVLDLNPRRQENDLWLGRTYYEMRRYAEAETHLDRALVRRPDHAMGRFLKTMLYLSWDGNTERARRAFDTALERTDLLRFLLTNWDFDDAMVLRIFADDLADRLQRRALRGSPDDSAAYYLAKADAAVSNGRTSVGRAYSDSARVVLEPRVELRPDRLRGHGNLGLAYAGLGRFDDAKRAGERAIEPIAGWLTASYNGPRLARIYVMMGDYDAAVDRLEQLLSAPSIISVPLLRFDPVWDPLRGHPRFEALLARDEN